MNTGLEYGTATGLSTQDIRITVAKIIRAALGLLGIIGIVVVLAGGFLWMTSGGEEEKITKAKKLLTNGAIGLTIILLSFSIAQFVISRLHAALYGSGSVQIATEGGGTLPSSALAGGCLDQGGEDPFICSIQPTSPAVGALVTVRGYRFGTYVAGTSKVRISTTEATIARCEGQPSWSENTVVFTVPDVLAGQSHLFTLTAGSGRTATSRMISIATGSAGPGIACMVPGAGPSGGPFTIWGVGFGDTQESSAVTFGGNASVGAAAAWSAPQIQGAVPATAQSGEVTVMVASATSNPYPFTVTCAADADCVGGSCVQGQCVGAGAGGAGGAGAVEGPIITNVSPQTLVSTTDGTAYRRSEDVPTGTQTVVAPNGAPGNYVTISGRGFGATAGRVIFLGADGAADDKVAALAPCASVWSDRQVVVVVPEGAGIGPIRIETAGTSPLADQTDDAKGTAIEYFRPNATSRPGLCAITPAAGQIGAAVTIAGVQFGASRGTEDAALFGDIPGGATGAWSATSVATTVPTLAEGIVSVRVRADGELSNEVAFTREAAPRVPRIQEIVPNRGGGGQYATIRGEHFGSAIGKIFFKRGTDEFEVVPRFPDACRQEWWKDGEITVRIPATANEWGPPAPPAEFNALGLYEVRVEVSQEGGSRRSSNAASFEVTADRPTPGICAIVPASGPARTLARLIGERFGSAEGIIGFFNGQTIGDADKNNFQWRDGEVSGILVPATTRTGPVRLWRAGDDANDAAKGSNPVTFEVRDCRQGGASACAEGRVCCGNGTCVASAAACTTGPTAGSYQWSFATGVIPKVPRVVESCNPTEPSVIPSPSPWDQQGQGMQACVNANIAVRFTQSMALDPDKAAAGVQVFRCGGGTNAAAAAGDFEAAALPAGWSVVDSAWVSASRGTLASPRVAGGGTGVLRLEKTDLAHAKASDQPRTTDLPRDAPLDRHYFAVEAPPSLIADTDGTTYAARVFVKGLNANQNPNMRAGIVVGRTGGPQPADSGWWQQASKEVVIDGTWQELSTPIIFDSGPNKTAGGFVRLYITGPPRDAPANQDDMYSVDFDDLEIVRQGDPCATREEVDGLAFQVTNEVGRLRLEDNVVTVAPPAGAWAIGSWYEVIVAGDGTNALKGAGAVQLRLDGDKDGVEGGNYRFRFRTRDSSEACAIQHVATAPQDVVATQPGPSSIAGRRTADDPGLTHFRADGVGDPAACFTLSTGGMDWAWTATQPVVGTVFASVDSDGHGRWCATANECAVVTCVTNAACAPYGGDCNTQTKRCATTFCSANRCNFTPRDATRNLFSNTATARAVHETPLTNAGVPQSVEVRATVAAATPRFGTSDLTIRFEKPRITAVYPTASCQQACPNGTMAAIANINLRPSTVDSPASNVKLYKCTQENCRREDIKPENLVSATAAACPQLPADSDPCARSRVGDDPQVIITGVTLDPNTSYRVIIRGGANGVLSAWDAPLEGLNYADNATGAVDAYSWTFRTRSEPCQISRIAISPDPVVFTIIGERATVAATPFSSPDQCSPQGQPINAETVQWQWDVANASGNVANFTTVSAAGAFTTPGPSEFTRTTRVAGPSCTLSCLRPGSRRVSGICGNGVLETPAEECEKVSGAFASWCDAATCLRKGARPVADGGTCGDGVVQNGAGGRPAGGEECDKVGMDGAPNATGEFPAWCNAATCLNRGSAPGSSACGNRSVGDGEDCDDGNTADGDGCSSRCLSEGAPPLWPGTVPAQPSGVLARCGDGIVANGQGGRPDGGEECDLGPVPPRASWTAQGCDFDRCVKLGAQSLAEPGGTCGNGTIQGGEQCDDGAVGFCNSDSGTHVGQRCTGATAAVDCGAANRCEDLQPVSGDGCSAACLLEGASIVRPQPSMCGDGRVHVGEACELGDSDGPPDPAQMLQAIGQGTANAEHTQLTTVEAEVGGASGSAEVRLQCGYERDDQCPNSVVNGVDRQGCCWPRPTIAARLPEPDGRGVCRNVRVTVQFNQLMDGASVGAVTDITTGASFQRGAVLEQQTTAGWKDAGAGAVLAEAMGGENGDVPVSELRFTLSRALEPDATYRVRVLDLSDDTVAQSVSVRSADGVRLGDDAANTWTFQTGAQVCTINRTAVTPASYLLQRRESRAPLEATAIARTATGDAPITKVAGTYAWEYAWESGAADIAVTDPGTPQDSCGDRSTCRFKPAEPAKNGDALASATIKVMENVFSNACTAANAATACGAGRSCVNGHCVGESFSGRSQLRAFICENPWPAVTNPATWTAHKIVGENISLAYCRDFGSQKVCRVPSPTNAPEAADARTCADDATCRAINDQLRCLPALLDDLPAFGGNPVTKDHIPTTVGTDELRKELFFLPRGASYCSVSGERCDPTLAGICPAGEFCRAGQDAIGLRLYENEQHVSAVRWFQQQGFTDTTTPITVDGYRGIQSGRSVYVNVANTGSVFTNLSVLSVNDGAVLETKEILNQALKEVRFTTNLIEQNTRICSDGQTRCTADANCAGGACAAPKDKLRRDIQRLEDLNEIRFAVEQYGRGNARCSISGMSCDPAAAAGQAGACSGSETCFTAGPDLAAGSFIPGFTMSKWPSWAAELGKAIGIELPVDPLNAFGGACGGRYCGGDATKPACTSNENCDNQSDARNKQCLPNAKYDQVTCWNQEESKYTAASGSYLYEYKRTPTGTWEVRGGFEYIGSTPNAGEPARNVTPAVPAKIAATPGGVPTTTYSASGRCGDVAVVLGVEECDPPGDTESQTCTTGFQFRTCQQDCKWSSWGSCTVACGNGRVDDGLRSLPLTTTDCNCIGSACNTLAAANRKPCRDGHGQKVGAGEQCDVGLNGGRVRPYGSTVPGITTGTEYACSPSCIWDGGRCGDNIAQTGYGEQCDGTANVATTTTASAPTVQYECTLSTDSSPCQRKGGYCGDLIIQDGSKKYCVRGTTWTTKQCAGNSDCVTGEVCTTTAGHSERCDGPQTRSCVSAASVVANSWKVINRSQINDNWETWYAASSARTSTPPFTNQAWTNSDDFGWKYNLNLQKNGDVRMTFVTSNSDDSVANLTRDVIEAGASGRAIGDFNPNAAQGGVGIYHRLRIRYITASTPSVYKQETIWAHATAPTQPQTTSVVLQNIQQNSDILVLWDNDWHYQTSDSNLRIYSVTFEATQALTCGDPGTTYACKDATAPAITPDPLGWSTCQAPGALCGNGMVDAAAGEECDDGGTGRCSNDLLKECRADSECNAQNQTGNTCQKDIDGCTSLCKRNECDDGQQLAPTCTAGESVKIGKPCRTAANCGRGGVCSAEACDLGASNWRVGNQCRPDPENRCIKPDGTVTNDSCLLQSTNIGGIPLFYSDCSRADGKCGDPQCVDDAPCPYGRTCNYCTTSCSIATKQGGYCGDALRQSPAEECDDGTPAQREAKDWKGVICDTQCTAKCPDAYVATRTRIGGDYTSYKFSPGQAQHMNITACRLLNTAKVDVSIDQGIVEIRPKISVVIVTDRSDSMGTTSTSKLGQVRTDLAGSGGLLDKLAALSDKAEVRVGLVSYGTNAVVDQTTPFLDVFNTTNVETLKTKVRGYTSTLGITYTNKAIDESNKLINGWLGSTTTETDADAKIIILLSDGAATNVASTYQSACLFKTGNDGVRNRACTSPVLSDRFIFTIAFPSTVTDMDNWSSGDGYKFAGGDLASFYASIAAKTAQIADAVAGVEITLLPPATGPASGGQYDGGVQPASPTTVTRTDGTTYTRYPVNISNIPNSASTRLKSSQDGLELTLNNILKESCNGKDGTSNFWIRVDYRLKAGVTGAGVTLSEPATQVCHGPPWK